MHEGGLFCRDNVIPTRYLRHQYGIFEGKPQPSLADGVTRPQRLAAGSDEKQPYSQGSRKLYESKCTIALSSDTVKLATQSKKTV